MSAETPTHKPVHMWFDIELCDALDAAARDARSNRTDYVRRIILESVRASGHFTSSPTPRRRRVRRAAP